MPHLEEGSLLPDSDAVKGELLGNVASPFAWRELRGVLDDDWLPARCDIASPTIASTDSVLKFNLNGSLPKSCAWGLISETVQEAILLTVAPEMRPISERLKS